MAGYRKRNPEVKKWPADLFAGTKVCSKCKSLKALDAFYWDKKRDAPEPKCKECVTKMHKAKRDKNPKLYYDLQRDHDLRRKFGIDSAEYDAILHAQSGRCKLCRTTQPGRKVFLVDHDHATGKVRGLLCSKCNAGLGMFNDDPHLMRIAIAYLEAGGVL